MANCPKIKYESTTIDTLIVNGTEVYDLNDKNGKLIYHKHIEGVCKTKHQGTNRCDGKITRYSVSPSAVVSDRWDLTTWCTNGHQNFSSPMKYDGKSYEESYGNPVGNICNMNLGTYDYYTYSCGYENETTESDITDVTDFIWLKP